VKYCPKGDERLFSISNELSSEGAKLSSNRNCDVILTYPNGQVISFDRKLKTKLGWIPGVDGITVVDEVSNLGATYVPKSDENDLIRNRQVYHAEIGHPNMQTTIMTANAQNIKLEGPADVPCVSCAIGKARKKRISKQNLVSRSKIPGERLFLDISSQKVSSLGGNMHWLLVLDDCTDNGFSFFLKEKSQTSEVMIPFLKLLERHFGKGVKYICCDNSGEIKLCKQSAKKLVLELVLNIRRPGHLNKTGVLNKNSQHFGGECAL
jgi:hypothetical protein